MELVYASARWQPWLSQPSLNLFMLKLLGLCVPHDHQAASNGKANRRGSHGSDSRYIWLEFALLQHPHGAEIPGSAVSNTATPTGNKNSCR